MQKKLTILLTNDDGIQAEGINVLFDVLSEDHEIYMIAPDSERSACSNAFHVGKPLTFTKHDDRHFSVSGYPADCSGLGINSDLFPTFDLVVSGINHGTNIGEDVHFSGTVAGARTAVVFRTTGIAISLDSYHKPSKNFKDAAKFLLKYLNKNTQNFSSDTHFLNINFPDLPISEIKGVQYTKIGSRNYYDTYEIQKTEGTTLTVHMKGNMKPDFSSDTDVSAIQNSIISITPLTLDSTDYNLFKKNSFILPELQ